MMQNFSSKPIEDSWQAVDHIVGDSEGEYVLVLERANPYGVIGFKVRSPHPGVPFGFGYDPARDVLWLIGGGEGVAVIGRSLLHLYPIVEQPICGFEFIGSLGLLVFDYTDLALYGPEGVLWRLDRLSDDGIEIEQHSGDSLRVRIWSGAFGYRSRVVNLRSGILIG